MSEGKARKMKADGTPDNRTKPGWRGPEDQRWMKGKQASPAKKALKEALEGQITYDELADQIIGLAKEGNIRAIEIILDRTAGKAVQDIENNSDNVDTTITLRD